MAEYWDLYDENRNPLGKRHRRGDELGEGEFHIVVQVWTRDNAGRFLISTRHPDKPFPLYYECVGGSVTEGEDSITGAMRELSEEIGLHVSHDNMKKLGTISDRRHTIYDVYQVNWNGDPASLTLQDTEVVAAEWMTYAQLCRVDDQDKLVPTLRYFREWFTPKRSG